MGSGCCKTTKVADISHAVVQTQTEVATKIPYGYVIIYSGVLTTNETYTCPMLSVHTYHQEAKKTEVGYNTQQISNKKKYNQLQADQATSKEEELSLDETVIMIPVEDIINVYYTSGVKKSVKAMQTSLSVPVVADRGCCSCCADSPEPVREVQDIESKNAERVITIHLQYSKYSNLDTVSNARILPEQNRAQFYSSKFQPDVRLDFYLVRNTEFNSDNFDTKRMQAENLCRIIMQLKGMNSSITTSSFGPPKKDNISVPTAISYPSPHELQRILEQPQCGIFGDVNQERQHSIQTKQNFGTHVPVPITTTTATSLTMKPAVLATIANE